jgi:nucleotidyltransferase substrate binding protein (TIGR01987 family)
MMKDSLMNAPPPTLLIAPLTRALATLDEALVAVAANPENLLLRDGLIQRFEYCYELALKMLLRALEQQARLPQEIDALNFKETLLLAAEKGLLDEPLAWLTFREARNKTSHSYNAAVAGQVAAAIPAFRAATAVLVQRLTKRIV